MPSQVFQMLGRWLRSLLIIRFLSLITDYLNQPIDLVGYEENFSA